ncbi:hypothetical protein G7084_07475 [Weissella coleopterorum]|uniref:Pentapeptide repeat-containing protein n=1 Tax=Weissella coleopterorum TaxID=2714949 RepID=A0A6G8B1Y0_9LACO|nr:pentapeptide repeat-containing protein [Weissella coleopterorum]QIL51143.1 hypothetical protein G7084_07475 [Weissella coleopterorum]
MIENKVMSLDEVEIGEKYFKCEFTFSNGNLLLDDITFDSCIFKQDDFSLADILDCTFINCDLSNFLFNESNIYRTKFKNDRLLGSSWIGANLKDIKIEACQGDLSNFSAAKITKSVFSDTALQEAYFQDVEFKNQIIFDHCNIDAIDVTNTKLKQVQVASSSFSAISFSPELMKGLQLNIQQGMIILNALGLDVKD